MTMTRRVTLIGLLALLTPIVSAEVAAAQGAPAEVTVRFTWKLKGEYAPFYVAQEKGYYGADVAVPVFRNIAERAARYLAIPMERQQPQPLPKETLAMTGVRTVN